MDIIEQSLRRVKAPSELWDRVNQEKQTRPRRPSIWIAMLACGAAAMAWAFYVPSLKSTDPVVVRQWVKARTGTDIPLTQSGTVRLTGARVAKTGGIELTYRTGDRTGIVQISRAENGRAHWESFVVECEAAACALCHS
jgi:hypothetical protein